MSQRGTRTSRRREDTANNEGGIPAWFRPYMAAWGQNAPPAPPAIDFPKLCKDFHNLGGVSYLGTESFVETQTWIRVCDRIFSDLGRDGDIRRLIASRHLRGKALYWWEIVIEEVDERTITWDDFKRRFEIQFDSEAEKVSNSRSSLVSSKVV